MYIFKVLNKVLETIALGSFSLASVEWQASFTNPPVLFSRLLKEGLQAIYMRTLCSCSSVFGGVREMSKSHDIFAKFPSRRAWDVGPQTSCTNTFSCSYIKTTPPKVVRLKGVMCACVCVYELLSLYLSFYLGNIEQSQL